MRRRFWIFLLFSGWTLSCGTGVQELPSIPPSDEKPEIPTAEKPGAPFLANGFESFAAESISEQYQLLSSVGGTFSQPKMASETFQWSGLLFEKTAGGVE